MGSGPTGGVRGGVPLTSEGLTHVRQTQNRLQRLVTVLREGALPVCPPLSDPTPGVRQGDVGVLFYFEHDGCE